MSSCSVGLCVFNLLTTPVLLEGRGLTGPLPRARARSLSGGNPPGHALYDVVPHPLEHLFHPASPTPLGNQGGFPHTPLPSESSWGNPDRGRQSGQGSPDDQIVWFVPKWEDQVGGDPAPSPPLSGAGAGEEKGASTCFGGCRPWTPSREASASMRARRTPGSVPTPRYTCPPRLEQASQAASIWPFLPSLREGSIYPGSCPLVRQGLQAWIKRRWGFMAAH